MPRPIVLCLLFVLPACGLERPPEEEGGSCLKLSSQGEPQVSLPARISLLFTVDTCSGAPVPHLTVDNFQISEDGSPISPFESRMALMPRAQKHRTYTALLLDMSGSILQSGAWPDLRAAVERFVHEVLERPGDGHQLALLTFDGRAAPVEWVGFTDDRDRLLAALETLQIQECQTNAGCSSFPDRASCAGWRCVDDSTNLYGAVVAGARRVAEAASSDESVPFRQAALVVFTDGTDQAARASLREAEAALDEHRPKIFTVGLGGEVDAGVLRSLGRDGFVSASIPGELGAAFHQVADRLTSIAGRFYALDYCSPKRRGKHTLELAARFGVKDGVELQGRLQTDFLADGFGPGCDVFP